MKYLFTPDGKAALAEAVARRPLLAFDFDGTLAPIVTRPSEARVADSVALRLQLLGDLLPLAVITGRSVDDVTPRLTFKPKFIVGSHGAEDPAASERLVRPSMLDGARERLRENLADLSVAGVMIEDKGYSIALHYRLARDPWRAQQVIEGVLTGIAPQVQVFGGKLVVNLVAAEAPDKARTLELLIDRCGGRSAFFAGDDINDEPVFARGHAHWFTVRVGREQRHSQAMYFIHGASEMVTMLDLMLSVLQAA